MCLEYLKDPWRPEETFCHSDFSKKTLFKTGVKNVQMIMIIIIILIESFSHQWGKKGTSGGVTVSKLDKQTYTSESESHWVPISYGLVLHLSKKLSKSLQWGKVEFIYILCVYVICYFFWVIFFIHMVSYSPKTMCSFPKCSFLKILYWLGLPDILFIIWVYLSFFNHTQGSLYYWLSARFKKPHFFQILLPTLWLYLIIFFEKW